MTQTRLTGPSTDMIAPPQDMNPTGRFSDRVDDHVRCHTRVFTFETISRGP